MKEYRHANWVQFRRDVIRLHNGRCARCLRSPSTDGVVLQVHHKRYIRGRLPWEYSTSDCEALCKGCHAEEHGHIMPRQGWTWVGVDDLGDLSGACELCGTEIRYVYAVEHQNWGSMAVGTVCCDRMTSTTAAAEHHERYMKMIDARKRFVSSVRWKQDGESSTITQKKIGVRIEGRDGSFRIKMNGIEGKRQFDTLLDAKMHAFDTIYSGLAAQYLERKSETHEMQRVRAWLATDL